MRFRWTMKELEEATDEEIIRGLIVERQSDLFNIYSPLYRRLQKIYNKIDKTVMDQQIKKGEKLYASKM